MDTEREHLNRAEELAASADAYLHDSLRHRQSVNTTAAAESLRYAEVCGVLAQARAQLAAVHALTAEPPGSPRTAGRAAGFPDRAITNLQGRHR
jgi:hypothetical protein